jgi:GNAT superfamily N-acetyltransferase
MAVTVRDAQLADMPAVGHIYVLGHWAGYRGCVPYGHLRAMSAAIEAAQWTNELNHPGAIFLVAINRTPRVVGFIYGGMTIAAQAGLAELFVDPPYRGKGVAQALLIAFAQRVQALGATTIRGPVAVCNARSRAFCTKTGAVEVNSPPFPVFGNVPGKQPISLPAVYEDWGNVAGMAAGHLPP